MARVFNMGVGFVVICEPGAADAVVAQLAKSGVPAWKIGDVTDGEVGVVVA
jgi:phosphoribosylformylglycinamidine cyclo-ligase